jgi:lipid-A-disaccharide synthase
MAAARILMVAGEPSGDLHAAQLAAALQALAPGDIDLFGCAGPEMRRRGVEAVVRADDMAIMGVPEIARALPMYIRASRRLLQAADDRRADAAILVDFPEFNLKLARLLKRRGMKVIYYISPQLWGWRQYRKRSITRDVDLLLSVLSFEKDWYAARGITNVEFVGHPLAGEVFADMPREEFCRRHELDPHRPLIALLPGSREREVARILPPLLDTAAIMKARDARLQFVVALARDTHLPYAREVLAQRGPAEVRIVCGETYNALGAANAAAVASGTATLEAGMMGTPMAVVYKASSLNYQLVKRLISIEHIGLINLVAGERIAKEFIQDAFEPRVVAEELERLLDPGINRDVREKLLAAAARLGPGGASARAAEAVLRRLGIETKKADATRRPQGLV